jgi:hypothetical protein
MRCGITSTITLSVPTQAMSKAAARFYSSAWAMTSTIPPVTAAAFSHRDPRQDGVHRDRPMETEVPRDPIDSFEL